MKNVKTALVLFLCLAMLAAFAGCAGAASSSAAPAPAGSTGAESTAGSEAAVDEDTRKITFVYMTLNNIPEADALQSVQDELNAYTVPNISTEVELILYNREEYQTQVNLMLASGEQADLFRAQSSPTINFINDGIALDITEYLEEGAALYETAQTVYPGFLKLATVDSRVYGVNAMGSNYVPKGWTYRVDIVEELGIDLSGVQDFNDLTDIFAQVKEAYPNMILIDNVRADTIFEGYLSNYNHIDALSDGFSPPPFAGVVREGETEVQNLYEMEETREVMSLTREWYEKGYFAKDAATTTATTAELLSSGNCFSVFVGLGNPKIASTYSANYGYEFDNIEIAPAWLQNGNKETWMINANSEAPENAARFLNLLYTNEYVDNLLVYGIEGRDYQLDADGYVIPPEGYSDLNGVPYTCNMGYYFWGNKWITYLVTGGLDYETNRATEELNYSAPISDYYGFLFDYSGVEAEYTALKNVIEEYKKAIWVGSLDVDTALEEINSKLYASGLETVLAAKQEQFDTWLSQQ